MTMFENRQDAEKYLAENIQFNAELSIKERAVRIDGKRGKIPSGMSKVTRFQLVIPYADRKPQVQN